MARIKSFGCICPRVFFTGHDTHIVVILLFEDSDKFIRNIRRDLNRRTLDKCPVIGKYLISDPYDPVRFVDRIVVIDIEFTSEIKEEYVRVSLYVIIRERNDNA